MVAATTNIDTQLLQSLVPINALTADHLDTLLRDQQVEVLCAGQSLFSIGDYDNYQVYLLSGAVCATDNYGEQRLINATDPECRFPLLDHQPRQHRLVATEDCQLIRFDRDRLDAMLAWDQACSYIALDIASERALDEDADWMLTLLKSNLFYKVPPMNIRLILDKFTPCYVPAGEVVIRQGEVGDCCYFIKEGSVAVYQSADGKSSPVKVNELGVGRCFGEDALVNETVRNASIEMQQNGVLMKLSKSDFFLLLKQPRVDTLSLTEAHAVVENGGAFIDVRTEAEFDQGHLSGALHMPLNLLKLKSRLLDKSRRYVLYCNSGRRSEAAAHLLGQEGFALSAVKSGVDLSQ